MRATLSTLSRNHLSGHLPDFALRNSFFGGSAEVGACALRPQPFASLPLATARVRRGTADVRVAPVGVRCVSVRVQRVIARVQRARRQISLARSRVLRACCRFLPIYSPATSTPSRKTIPMNIRKSLDALKNTLFKGNATVIGEWATASHVERQGSRKAKPANGGGTTPPTK